MLSIESVLDEKIIRIQSVCGECTADNFLLYTQNESCYFLKTGRVKGMFSCEANGLKEIALSNTFRVPQVIAASTDFLLMEYIFTDRKDPAFFPRFGEILANMHHYTHTRFGFYENNYIGTNRQINEVSNVSATSWTSFYFENRLLYQYKLAEKNGYVSSGLQNSFRKLESVIHTILDPVSEAPALLHGDLWRGNYLCDENNQPVLIDPAVYYGHRETDLAMSKLFGGFTASFYKSYNKHYPLSEGWEYRENIYKLYHVLNHLNLFGTGYLSEAESLIRFYL